MNNNSDYLVRFKQNSNVLEVGGGGNPLTNTNGDRVTYNMDAIPSPNVDVVHDASVFPWPMNDASFDGVYSVYCWEHIEWRKSLDFLKEIYRILRSDGKIIIITSNTLEQCKRVVEEGVTKGTSELLFGSQEFSGHAGVHKSAFSPDYAKKLFEEAGFSVVKTFPHPVSPTDFIIEAYKNPIEKNEKKEIFERSYFEDGSYGYKDYRDFCTHYCTAKIILNSTPKVENVLSVGCGRGYVARILENNGVKATGMDVSNHCWHTRVIEDFILWDARETPWHTGKLEMLKIEDKEYDLCCHPDTLIEIKNGKTDKIKDIKIGDKVLTHTGKYKKVLKIFKRKYTGNMLSIQPYYFSFPIIVTPEHPIYAKKVKYVEKRWKKLRNGLPDPAWISSDELAENDVVLFPRNTEISDIEKITFSKKFFVKQHSNYELYKKVIALKKNELTYDEIKNKLGVPRKTAHQWVKNLKHPKYCYYVENDKAHLCTGTKGIFNEIKTDEDFCRLIGYYLSDGCSNIKTGQTTIILSKNELDYAKDIKKIIAKIFGLKTHIHNEKNTIRVLICSKELSFFIHHIINDGKKRTALTKEIPFWMMKLPMEKQKQLIVGLIRGDGCERKDAYVYASSSFQLINQVKNILLRLDIISSVRKQSDGGELKFKDHMANAAPSYTITISGKQTEVFTGSLKDMAKRSRTFNFGWIDNNYAMLPIRKISSIRYDGYVYNLEVEDDNSYVSSCILHNCLSMNFLEHIEEDRLDGVLREMARVSNRGMHGIHMTDSPFEEMDRDIDSTHRIKQPKIWWENRFKTVVPNYNVVVEHPRLLEYEDPSHQPPISNAPGVSLRDGKLHPDDGLVKVNLGSFKDCFYFCWKNIDIIPLHEFARAQSYDYLQHDVTKGLPMYKDGEVDLLFSSHLLEHLDRTEGKKLLQECFRVMKSGAVIRLSIPDTKTITEKYLDGCISEYRYVNTGVEDCMDDCDAYYNLLLAGHKTIYDEDALRQLLETVGFKNIETMSPFKSRNQTIQTQTSNCHQSLSCILEAEK